MKIRLNDLLRFGGDYDLTIRSLDLALYQAEVELAGHTRLLCDDGDAPARSLQLVQQSAYDEMIGQPLRETSNAMAVPLEPLPRPGGTGERHDS